VEEEMAKVLTAAAVARLKPDRKHRREIPDCGAKGLYLVIEPSGTRSWSWRYRRPGSGTSANLRLGRVDLSGREHDGDPQVGDPLTLAAARALAADCERQRLRGHDPAAEKQIAKQQARIVRAEREAKTFSACVRTFCDEYRIPRKGCKPKGWRRIARHLGLDYPADGGDPMLIPKGLCDRWRERSIIEIGGNDIHAVVIEAIKLGIPGMGRKTEGPSDVRGKKLRDSLGSLFRWLLEHRRIVTDPTLGVFRPPQRGPRNRVLNTDPNKRRGDECRWFWAACDKVGAPYAQALRLLLLTGCRLREVTEMRWTELNDDFSVLHLSGARTKNGREHIIPLPPLAQDIVRSVPRIEGPANFVFSTNGRTPSGSWNRVKAKLDETMLTLAREEHGDGATIEAWVIHDLRRSAASGMADIGVPPHIIEACLNHSSGAKGGIAGVYNRAEYSKEKTDALIRWSEHVQRVVSGESGTVVPIGRKRGA
jgi:integrase